MVELQTRKKPSPFSEGDEIVEPYLALCGPHSNIILTPYRELAVEEKEHTVDRLVELHNDERVYRWLMSPPFPYKREHAESWISRSQRPRSSPPTAMKPWTLPPVQSIREIVVGDTGQTELFIGDITLRRHVFEEVVDLQQREALSKENLERENGDPKIVWAVGNFLAPSHHGRGIATAAARTLLDWAIPNMNIHRLIVQVFEGNFASARVYEKLGFVFREAIKEAIPIAESKGGGRRGILVYTLER